MHRSARTAPRMLQGIGREQARGSAEMTLGHECGIFVPARWPRLPALNAHPRRMARLTFMEGAGERARKAWGHVNGHFVFPRWAQAPMGPRVQMLIRVICSPFVRKLIEQRLPHTRVGTDYFRGLTKNGLTIRAWF